MKFLSILMFLFCISFLSLKAQNTSLQQSVTELKNDPYLKQSNWGLIVINCSKNSIVEEFNADNLLIPASIVKLTSTATALDILGDSFRFETKVYIDGFIDDNGILQGNLNIIGGADPTIGLPYFKKEKFIDSLYTALKNMGINGINGNICGYAGIFDSLLIPDTYPSDDRGNYYGAGTSGLIWDGNAITYTFSTPSALGAKTTLKSVFPKFENLYLENKTTSGRNGTGDNSIIWGGPFEFNQSITGTLPPGKNNFEVYGSSPDPALGFTLAIKYFLEERNFMITGHCMGFYSNKNDNGTLILTYSSPPLSEIIKFTNTKSHNLTAETCLKMAGLKKYGTGSYFCGLRAVNDLIRENFIDSLSMQLHDGSGLSKKDNVSPRAFGMFLNNIRHKIWFDTFYSSLPVAGETGTLATMFSGSNVKGKLRAKSGYMKTVRSYAGYVPNQKNELMAFCIIVNNYSGNAFALKKKLENLMICISLSE